MRDLAFNEDPVAQLIVDQNQMLAFANGRARELFGLTQRDLGRPFQEFEVSYRPVELRSVINQLMNDRRPVILAEVAYTTRNNLRRWFDVHIAGLFSTEGRILGVKISFQDVSRARELADEVQQSKSDLETAYEELQSSNEELETTNEELQSTVEELETTNEELQSTNEELETMNEELQSTNEELENVNTEMGQRGEQLNEANAFLQSILASLKVGVVVIDRDLLIRAWNNRAEDLWGVRANEAANRHFLSLDIGLRVESLAGPIRDCLSGKSSEYETTMQATNRRGRSIQCQVSVNPLLESDKEVGGVVVLMEEVDGRLAAP